jgi:hypothetical protein
MRNCRYGQYGQYDRYGQYGRYDRYVSWSGFSISCGSRWVKCQWDIDVMSMRCWCLSFSKTAQCEDWEVLSDLNRKDSTISFRTHLNVILFIETKLPNCQIAELPNCRIAEFPLISKILEMHAEKIEAQLTSDRSVLKIQVLDNRGLISSLQNQSNGRIS